MPDTESSTRNDEHTSQSLGNVDGVSGTWQDVISASFSQLAIQFQAASHSIANAAAVASSSSSSPESGPALLALTERLEAIEGEQRRLGDAIEALKIQFESAGINHETSNSSQAVHELEPAQSPIAALEESLKKQQEAFKLEQERLPARLQNALATKSLSPLKMPPMKGHKLPTNAPATRGEFEHLTKERYEALMQGYGVPLSGDINTKREDLRAFLGIPSISLEKK